MSVYMSRLMFTGSYCYILVTWLLPRGSHLHVVAINCCIFHFSLSLSLSLSPSLSISLSHSLSYAHTHN